MPLPETSQLTGGCQCGAVRFRAESLGGAGVCHCRMCQKAFGSVFAAMVTAYGVTWTRGEPAWFESSDMARRAFCAHCGTPLGYDSYEEDGTLEIAIGAFDNPELAPPSRQVNPAERVSYYEALASLPTRPAEVRPMVERRKGSPVTNYQHPDHDTPAWTPHKGPTA